VRARAIEIINFMSRHELVARSMVGGTSSAQEVIVADRYIDYREVSEYGRFFWVRSAQLVGASPLVDIEVVRQRVLAEVEFVEGAHGSTRTQRSDFRIGQDDVGEAAPELADVLRRFFHHLKALPGTVAVDRKAFFPTGKLGKLHLLKPADVLARGDEVLHGFTVPANAALVGAADWQGEVTTARTTLADALAGKHQARGGASSSVGSLAAARERFLHVYNVLAKRLVHVVLADLGRMGEYRSFFLDLQVNEDGRPAPQAPVTPETPGSQPGDAAGAVPVA
jgi:hypothetical protein